MSPTTIAMVIAVVAAAVPVDVAADRSARSWVRAKWVRYRLGLAVVEVVATVVVALVAQRIGWQPAAHADGWTAVAHGVSWSVAAVAVLRAEVTGLEAATPGFSVLRTFSGWLASTLTGAIRDAVRAEYHDKSLAAIKDAAYEAVARMDRPQPDGSPTPAQIAYGSQIESYSPAAPGDPALCRQLLTTLVVDNHLTRLS